MPVIVGRRRRRVEVLAAQHYGLPGCAGLRPVESTDVGIRHPDGSAAADRQPPEDPAAESRQLSGSGTRSLTESVKSAPTPPARAGCRRSSRRAWWAADVAELDAARDGPLIRCFRQWAMSWSCRRLVAQRCAGRHDEGLHRRHLVLVRRPDDAGALDAGVGLEHLLHLRRVDRDARHLDDPLRAALEVEVAVRVHRADVAGVQPGASVVVPAQGGRPSPSGSLR